MQLHEDWRRIVRRAWSFRLIGLAALLSGCEAALPFVDLDLPAGLFAGLSFAVTGAALVARVVAQKGMRP